MGNTAFSKKFRRRVLEILEKAAELSLEDRARPNTLPFASKNVKVTVRPACVIEAGRIYLNGALPRVAATEVRRDPPPPAQSR